MFLIKIFRGEILMQLGIATATLCFVGYLSYLYDQTDRNPAVRGYCNHMILVWFKCFLILFNCFCSRIIPGVLNQKIRYLKVITINKYNRLDKRYTPEILAILFYIFAIKNIYLYIHIDETDWNTLVYPELVCGTNSWSFDTRGWPTSNFF